LPHLRLSSSYAPDNNNSYEATRRSRRHNEGRGYILARCRL